MGFRDRAKKLLRGHSDEPEEPQSTPSRPPAKVAAPVQEVNPPPEPPAPEVIPDTPPTEEEPKESLWEQAYILIQQESPKLIKTYELFLLQSKQPDEESTPETPPTKADFRFELDDVISTRLEAVEATRARIPLAKRTVNIRDHLDRVVGSVRYFQEFVGPLVGGEPHGAIVWAGVSVLITLVLTPMEQSKAALEGLAYISELLVRCTAREQVYSSWANKDSDKAALADLRAKVKTKTIELYAEILKYQIRVACQYARSAIHRIARNMVLADGWEGVLAGIKDIDQDIVRGLREVDADILRNIDEIVVGLQPQIEKILALQIQTKDDTEFLRQEKYLEKLDRAPAAYNCYGSDGQAPVCFPDTRVNILQQLKDWRDGVDSKPILWLYGMAGTGKSTLSRTVATQAATDECLVGSFFFSNGSHGDGKTLFTTLASQLAELTFLGSGVRSQISKAIAEDPDIGKQNFQTQLKRLILKPLSEETGGTIWSYPLLIVIDALDECKSQADVKQLLTALGESKDTLQQLNLRFLITSRPGPPVTNFISRFLVDAHQELDLELAAQDDVHHDIELYVGAQLSQIQEDYDLGISWPGREAIESLVGRSGRLFIYAATACRYIESSPISPDWGLKELLQSERNQQEPLRHLYTMYEQIIYKVIGEPPHTNVEATTLFKRVVGTIAVLREPLNLATLQALLQIPEEQVKPLLNRLRAVLEIPADATSPIRLLHLSFRDFLLQQSGPDFCIDEQQANEFLLGKCIELTHSHLKYNICDLELPAALETDIDQALVEQHISAELKYACLNWVGHLQQCDRQEDNGVVPQFLEQHLLHWIEACSLMKKVDELVIMVQALKDLYKDQPPNPIHLQGLIEDVRNLLMNRRPTVQLSPLQVYSSALAFSPPGDLLEIYHASIPSWICKTPVINSRSRFKCTISPNGFASFTSLDGKLLATLTDFGSIEVYSLQTGNLLSELKAHEDLAMGAAFSHDGSRIASRFWSTIKCWDLQTRECYSSYDFEEIPMAHGFSSDDHLLVLIPEGDDAYIRDVTAGSSHTLTELLNTRHDMEFSKDGKRLIVSSDEEHTISIFDSTTGACLGSLEAPNPSVVGSCYFKIVTSSDGETIVYAHTFSTRYTEEDEVSVHEVVYVRNFADGEYYTLPTARRCVDVAFSSDNRYLALASREEIKIWDLRTQTEYLTISNLGGEVFELKFAAGQLVIFFPFRKIRVIDLEDEIALQAAQDNPTDDTTDSMEGMELNRFPSMTMKSQPLSLSFSPDGRYLAATGAGCPVYLWGLSGESPPAREIEEETAQSVCFSPNNQHLACGTDNGAIMIYDVETLELQYTLEAEGDRLSGDGAPSLGLCYSPDGEYLVSAGPEVKVWHMENRELVNRITIVPDVRKWRQFNENFHAAAQYVRVGEDHFAFLLMAFPLVDPGFIDMEGYQNDVSYATQTMESLGDSVYPIRSPLAVDQIEWFITWNEEKLLYVPRDFQCEDNPIFAVHSASRTIALAGKSEVNCFQFDEGRLPAAIRNGDLADDGRVPIYREIPRAKGFNLSFMKGQIRQWQRDARG